MEAHAPMYNIKHYEQDLCSVLNEWTSLTGPDYYEICRDPTNYESFLKNIEIYIIARLNI